MRSSPRRFWRSRSRSSIFNGAGAASGRAPEQRLCRCPHTLQAGEAQATPPIGIGIKGRGSSPPSPPSFCPFPPSSQPHASVCTYVCTHARPACVWRAPLMCLCVCVWRCAIGYVVCERSQMGLKSFYLAVNCHFFFFFFFFFFFSSRGSDPHTPLGATAPPRPPELGPVARAAPQNVKLGYRQKSPLAVRPQKKQRCNKVRRYGALFVIIVIRNTGSSD